MCRPVKCIRLAEGSARKPSAWPCPACRRYTLLSLRDLAVSAGPFILLAVALLVLAYCGWTRTRPSACAGHRPGAKRLRGIRQALRQRRWRATASRWCWCPAAARRQPAAAARRQGRPRLRAGRQQRPHRPGRGRPASLGSLFVEPLWLFYREDAARKKWPPLAQAPRQPGPARHATLSLTSCRPARQRRHARQRRAAA
jgi:hypothetical protein